MNVYIAVYTYLNLFIRDENVMGLSIYSQITRIFLAIFFGSIIGFERRKLHKAAGVRTHGVITVICAMLTMVSAYGFQDISCTIDPTRLIANIPTGVGFLCGGVIYVTTKKDDSHSEESVVGLTTAAGIFGSAMIGIVIGLGYYPLAFITLIAIFLCLKMENLLKLLHLIDKDKDDST